MIAFRFLGIVDGASCIQYHRNTLPSHAPGLSISTTLEGTINWYAESSYHRPSRHGGGDKFAEDDDGNGRRKKRK